MTHAERRERRKKIAEAVVRGESLASVAAESGLSTYAVRLACEEHSVDCSKIHARKRDQFGILKLLMDGFSVRCAAVEMGVPRQTVRYVAERAYAAGFRMPAYRPHKNK